MYDVDGKKAHDETVIYDRGGWVFWMLYDFMGHERALRRLSQLHPDVEREPRPSRAAGFRRRDASYAADPAAYDAFVKQWFEDKVDARSTRSCTRKKTKAATGLRRRGRR